ncbi:hypothetical protein Pint_26163 [Pistacia integerrima]|uniref:Uncharacterized protein n=1 Tax=Pistacia integerrima TaxID=434235 RepID=A0ACC0YHK9_9ROSI|nr:hypothetical protein Pint_26163 [Pistacia integerrima]
MGEQDGLEGSQPVDLSKHPSGIVPTPYARIIQKLGFPAKFKVRDETYTTFENIYPVLNEVADNTHLNGGSTLCHKCQVQDVFSFRVLVLKEVD